MSDDRPPGLLDRAVDWIARAMDALGLNGSRLRWKWNQKRRDVGEAGMRSANLARSARGAHKMCPSCRALVPRAARSCPECDATLAEVAAPGVGRLLTNAMPTRSPATTLLLLVNGFWFAIMLMAQIRSSGGGLGMSFDTELLVRFGSGLSRARMLSGGEITGGEWWRLITPIFLHGGLLHFAFNSMVLFQLGPLAEHIYGKERFWTIYLCCGIAGSSLSELPRYVNTVGASGAIMGLMGLLLVYGWRRGGALGDNIKSWMLRFGMYILVFSVLFPNIDHLNHLGGFACGALLARLVPEPAGGRASAPWQFAAAAGVLLVLVAFAQVAMAL